MFMKYTKINKTLFTHAATGARAVYYYYCYYLRRRGVPHSNTRMRCALFVLSLATIIRVSVSRARLYSMSIPAMTNAKKAVNVAAPDWEAGGETVTALALRVTVYTGPMGSLAHGKPNSSLEQLTK